MSLNTTILQEESNGKYLWFQRKNQFSLLHNIHVKHYSFSFKTKRSILCAIYMHSLSYVILLIIGVPFESTLLAIKYYFHTSSILMYYLTSEFYFDLPIVPKQNINAINISSFAHLNFILPRTLMKIKRWKVNRKILTL